MTGRHWSPTAPRCGAPSGPATTATLIRFDPRDLRHVWFRHPDSGEFATLDWRGLGAAPVPFGDLELAWCKANLLAESGLRASEAELEEVLCRFVRRYATDTPAKRAEIKLRKAAVLHQASAAKDRGTSRLLAPDTADDPDWDADPDDIEPMALFLADQPVRTVRRRTVAAEQREPTPPLPPHPALPPAPTTKEEWNRYVDAPSSAAPPVLGIGDYRRLVDAERHAYDEARLAHHGVFAPISTPWMRDVHTRLGRQLGANLRNLQPGARRGSVISAKANRGKTTICMTFAKHYQRSVVARYGDRTPEGNRLIPVVYVTLPDDCRTKWLDLAICEFYAVQLPGQPTKDDLVRAIQRVARLTMTTLFIVDDIHYLNLGTREGQAVNDHLKYLANTIAATFVYAGIDCELTGLMTEGFSPSTDARSQTKSRFTLLDVGSFDDRSQEGRTRWRAVLAAFEPELALVEARPGDLSKTLAPYLYWRTSGVIGSISALLREGAALAVERGTERLSESLLDEVEVDADAEGQAIRRKRPSPGALAGEPARQPA